MKKRFSPDIIDVFEKYAWPGNIRELRNLVERMIVMSPDDIITKKDLPQNICESADCSDSEEINVPGIMPMKDALEAVEKQLIEKAYETFKTTRQMASHLKISAPSIVRKAAKYGIVKH